MNSSTKPLEFSLGNNFLEKMDLRTVLYPLWLNKTLIALIASICLLIGIFFASLKIPTYSSNVLLQLENQGNSLISLGKDSAVGALLPDKGGASGDVQTALIKSRYILEPVVRRLNLDISVSPVYFPVFGEWYAKQHSDFINTPWWGSSRYAWGGEEVEINQFQVPTTDENKSFSLIALAGNRYELYDAENQLILRGEVGKLVTAMAERGQYTLQVQKLNAGTNAHFSLTKKSIQKIVDQLAGQIQIHDVSQDMNLRTDTGIMKISITGTDPQYIIGILNTIAEVTVEKNAEKKAKESTKTLAFMNKQLPRVKQSLDLAETKLNLYLAKERMVDLNSETKLLLTSITDVYKNLNLIRMNKAAALQKYTPAHPFIIAMEEKQNYFESELKSLRDKASQLPARDQKVVSLMRDARVKGQLYLILLNKIQSLEVIKGGTVSDVSIIGLATLPDQPLPAGKISLVLFSLLAGLVLGSAIVYVQHLMNRKISDPTLIESQFGLTNLAIVPYSDKQNKLLVEYNPKHNLIPLLAQSDPKDLSIEALRSFRTSSQFAMIDAVNNIISIIGVAPGVGKSFVSVNYAYLQADAGKKVLLIDGDIRKGHLRDYFNVGKTNGLTEVICGSCLFEDALIQGPIQNLDFLATGSYPPNPSELLMSPRFRELLDRVSKKYDLVIIDTAPILAVTDAVVIANYTGSNFLVIASNTHESREIELAIKRLTSNGIAINGVVFNFSQEQKGLYRYSHPTFKYQYEYN